ARASVVWSEGPVYWKSENRTAFSGVLKLSVSELLGKPLFNDRQIRACVYPSRDHWLVRIGFWFCTLRKLAGVENKKTTYLKAMNSGRIHAVLFLEGALVPAHEPLLTLEAFGVLVPHALPIEVRVGKWQVIAEDRVQVGQELAHLIMV
ncbi:MAG: hypothetical protein ABIQ95_17020, partial [Bdellovibrionia bacterium]